MQLDSDDFELFGLERRFAQDGARLDERRRALQAEVHPDRFASEGARAQRVSTQWAVRVNEAYRRLRDPIKRAAYLCELNGAPIEAESNTSMPVAFLHQQLAWREALADADSAEAVEALSSEVAGFRAAGLERLEDLLDSQADFAAAARELRALMFVERFAHDVDRRLEALGQ